MKKITAIVSTVLLLIGASFAQSTNINDYALEDIYLYYGELEQLGQKFSSTYSFSKTPEFAAETDNYYTALINKKIVPLARTQEQITIPITMEFEKENGFFCDGYFCKSYSISEENNIYADAIKAIAENREISSNRLDVPGFLVDYQKDNRPYGTKLKCETVAYLDGHGIDGNDMQPFTFKDTYIDAKGKQKKKSRTILILAINKISFKLSNEGNIIEVTEPAKESINTPFGTIEAVKNSLGLKDSIPESIVIGTVAYPKLMGFGYDAENVFQIRKDNELLAMYQTRKGYELKKDICGQVSAYYLQEKNSEIYMGSIHLTCTDKVWEKIHADITKKDADPKYIIDLRLINDEVVFVIAPAKKIYTKSDLSSAMWGF